MKYARSLAIPGYMVAALLISIPLLDTTLSVWPARAGEAAWRFGTFGLFSRALLTPLLGLLIAFAIALLLEQRAVLRSLAGLSGLVSVTLLAVLALFLLDALQMRAQVSPEMKLGFDLAASIAVLKYCLGIIVSLAFAVTGWRVSRRERVVKGERRRTADPSPELVLGSPAPRGVASRV